MFLIRSFKIEIRRITKCIAIFLFHGHGPNHKLYTIMFNLLNCPNHVNLSNEINYSLCPVYIYNT